MSNQCTSCHPFSEQNTERTNPGAEIERSASKHRVFETKTQTPKVAQTVEILTKGTRKDGSTFVRIRMNALFKLTRVLFNLSSIRPQERSSWYTKTRMHTRTEKSTTGQPQTTKPKKVHDGSVVLSVANTQGVWFHYTRYPEKE